MLNQTTGGTAATNLIRAFRVTSHSSATTTVTFTGNTATGANIGFQWLAGQNFAGNQAVRIWQNTLTNNDTGVLIQSNGIANLFQNTITGSGAAAVNLVTGELDGSGSVLGAVQENFITGGANHGIVVALGATVSGGIFNNDLSGNAGLAVNNLSLVVVNASGNWWGTNTAAGVAGEVSANVDYSPWLDVGTDTSATTGFQGDFSTLHVDDTSPQFGSGGHIQEGIDLASGVTTTVIIEAGTYLESVAANKAGLTLDGATGVATDVVIDPPAGNGIAISANDVTVRDLRVTGSVDGISASAVSGPTLTNVHSDTNTGAGVALSGVTGTTALTNVTSTGNAARGLLVNGAQTLNISGGTFSNNTDDGIELNNVTTATVSGVTVTGNTGVVADGLEAANVTTLVVTGGNFSGNADEGIDLLLSIATGTISGVTLTNNSGQGLAVGESGGGNTTLNLSDLTVTGNVGGGGNISNVITLNFTGTTGDVTDVITVSGSSLQHTRDPAGANVANQSLSLANVTNFNANGNSGSDTFNVNPAASMTISIDGDLPVPPTLPGDTLIVDTTGTTNPTLTSTSTPDGLQGSYTFADRQPVNFQEIETLSAVPTVSVSDGTAPEGEPVVFTLTLSAPSTEQVTVRVNTTSGSATGDVDYNQINSFNDVVFPPGETTQTIAIPTFEDTADEPDETFFLNVLQTIGVAVADGQGVGTIVDNPTVSVGDAAADEGDSVVFTLTLSAPSNQQVTVRVNTTSGTATGDVDYNQINSFNDIVFPPGETTQTIAIPSFEDPLGEPDETFFLNVLQTTGAGVADGQGVGTINDDDIGVTVDSNGKLLVEGTSDDDIVTITGVGTGTGVYLVTTQQGSQPPQTQTVTGVTGDICVFLHEGNDQLTMNNAYVNGSIIIEMDTGNDAVTLGHADVVSTRADLNVDLGTDNDTINGRRIFIGGNQNLIGGDGNDTMTFDGFASPFTLGTSAAGNANWTTGSGDDTVNVVYAFIGGAWAIDLGAGTDSLNIFGSSASGDVSFLGGAGDDVLTVDTNFFDADLLLDGGAERDTIFLANGLGTDVATIIGGGGPDTVTVRNESDSQLTIDTGAGEDTVEVRSSAFDRFFALLGDDNDQLTMFGSLFRAEMSRDGGPGLADRLRDQGNSIQGSSRTRNFELFG